MATLLWYSAPTNEGLKISQAAYSSCYGHLSRCLPFDLRAEVKQPLFFPVPESKEYKAKSTSGATLVLVCSFGQHREE
eukprot:990384-Pelagomonas_calceolata.AAC.1